MLIWMAGTKDALGEAFLRLQRERMTEGGVPPKRVTPSLLTEVTSAPELLLPTARPGNRIEGFIEVDVSDRGGADHNLNTLITNLKDCPQVQYLARVEHRDQLLLNLQADTFEEFDQTFNQRLDSSPLVASARIMFTRNPPLGGSAAYTPEAAPDFDTFVFARTGRRHAREFQANVNKETGAIADIVYGPMDWVCQFPAGKGADVLDALTTPIGPTARRAPQTVRVLQVENKHEKKRPKDSIVTAYAVVEVLDNVAGSKQELLQFLKADDYCTYVGEAHLKPFLVVKIGRRVKDQLDFWVAKTLMEKEGVIRNTTTYLVVNSDQELKTIEKGDHAVSIAYYGLPHSLKDSLDNTKILHGVEAALAQRGLKMGKRNLKSFNKLLRRIKTTDAPGSSAP